MLIRDAGTPDLSAIVAIYNSTIASQMVTGDTEAVSVESRLAWFQAHSPDRYPLWVAEDASEVMGWLGFQPFYGRPAYRATAELSLYVAAKYRRQGVGRVLLKRAIVAAPSLGLSTLLGFIFAQNHPSLRLFEHFGFQQWGYLPRVAQFGEREQDLVIMGLRVC